MNAEEAGNLLKVQSYQDGRQPSDGQIAVWADSLSDLTYDEALDAMRSLWKDSTDYMTPALIRGRVRQRHKHRAAHGRKVAAELASAKAKTCELCDDRGYRLPARRIVCDHKERRAVGAAAAVRRMLEAGGS